jgi:tetratricopeptide (TPR) repeat protein/TM2 domain-containing membrane protein YozV
MLYKVESLMEANKFDGALELLNIMLQKEPRNVELVKKKAKVLEKLKRYDEAIETFDLAYSLKPSHHLLCDKADIYYFYKDEPSVALPIYQTCLTENPADTYVLKQIARCYSELKDYQASISFYEKAILFEEDNQYSMKYVLGIKEALFEKGRALLAIQDFEEARSYFNKALAVSVTEEPYKVAPSDYSGYLMEGDFDPYEKIRNSLMEFNTFSEIGIADTYFEQQDFNKALSLYPYISKKGMTVEGLIHKAICYMEVGNPLNAYHCLKIAEKNQFDVKDKLQFIEKKYSHLLQKRKRGNEVLEALFPEVEGQLRRISNNKADIDANIQLFGGTLKRDLESKSFEDAFNQRYFGLDEYLEALATLCAGAVLLYKFSVPTAVYHHWVKQQHLSLQGRLMKLCLDKGNEQPIQTMDGGFLATVLGVELDEVGTTVKVKIYKQFVRKGNNIFFNNGLDARVVDVKDENGTSLEIAFEGQTVFLTLTIESTKIKEGTHLFKTRKHPSMWYTEKQIAGEQNSLQSLKRFNFPDAQIKETIAKLNTILNKQKKELLNYNGVQYEDELAVSIALAEFQIREGKKASVEKVEPQREVNTVKKEDNETKNSSADNFGDESPILFLVKEFYTISGPRDIVLQGKIERGTIAVGDWLESNDGIVEQVSKMVRFKSVIDRAKQGETVGLVFKANAQSGQLKKAVKLRKSEVPGKEVLEEKSPTLSTSEQFKKELANLSSQKLGDTQIKQKVQQLKVQYKMNEIDSIIYEAVSLGKIYSVPDFSTKSWEDKRNFVHSALDQTVRLGMKDQSLVAATTGLKDLKLISKFTFFELEKKATGTNLSASEIDKRELEFIKKVTTSYQNMGASPFGKNFLFHEDRYFDCARFINDFIKDRNSLDDKLLFSGKEDTAVINPKEGFAISSQAIYSYGWRVPILLRDIQDVYISQSQVFVETLDGTSKKIYTPFYSRKEDVVKFMKELLYDYVAIFHLTRPEKKAKKLPAGEQVDSRAENEFVGHAKSEVAAAVEPRKIVTSTELNEKSRQAVAVKAEQTSTPKKGPTQQKEQKQAAQSVNVVKQATAHKTVHKKKNKFIAWILLLFLGFLGLHRTYLGQPWRGVLILILNIAGVFFYFIPNLVTFIFEVAVLNKSVDRRNS